VPDCYYLVSSDAQKAARDVRSCVREVSQKDRPTRFSTDGKRVDSRVHFDGHDEAVRYLEPIKACIEAKGHIVHDYGIYYEFGEVGLSDDPPPSSGAQTTP
jgi:hypothetical protein